MEAIKALPPKASHLPWYVFSWNVNLGVPSIKTLCILLLQLHLLYFALTVELARCQQLEFLSSLSLKRLWCPAGVLTPGPGDHTPM